MLVGSECLRAAAQGRLEQDRSELEPVQPVQQIVRHSAGSLDAVVIIGCGDGDEAVPPCGACFGQFCFGDRHHWILLSRVGGVGMSSTGGVIASL